MRAQNERDLSWCYQRTEPLRWPWQQFRTNLSPLQHCLSKILLFIQCRKRSINSSYWSSRRLMEVSNWMHQSHHTIFISASICTKRQWVFLAGDSSPLIFHIDCQITTVFTMAEGNGQVRSFQIWTRQTSSCLELPSFSVWSTTLAFWYQSLTYTSSLMKPTHFTHLLSLFTVSAWPESTELHEASYTVGQQQPLNILQRLNETWINLFSVSFQNKYEFTREENSDMNKNHYSFLRMPSTTFSP